ncbi:MAG: glycoside hydrolase family 95 protein [Acidobacteria bacterium]|nr:glycoside hydrolase family 95 protein [Acidobacteriota bacterium]
MNKSFLKILMAFGVCVIIHVAGSAQSSQIWKLWYRQPAAEWNEALPVGNGRLGAMVMGGVTEEQIVLNDITLWSGGRQDADSPEAAKYLPEIRRLLLEGKNKEAEDLTIKYFVCLGKGSGRAKGADLPYGSFQVLGTMSMKFDYGAGDMTPRNYRRELDLNNAVSNTVLKSTASDMSGA